MPQDASATATPPDSPLTLTLTPADLVAERDLFDILISETQHFGKHGATPSRRSASGRVETKLTLLRDQIPQP